jgi:TPP-dependent 2-oxoacid decarboxylase
VILDGPFNDITPWNDYRLPEVLGSGRGFVVVAVEHPDAALAEVRAQTQSFCLLDVRLDPRDISPALRRLTARLAQQQGPATMRPGH